jgi:hypothetical protein
MRNKMRDGAQGAGSADRFSRSDQVRLQLSFNLNFFTSSTNRQSHELGNGRDTINLDARPL